MGLAMLFGGIHLTAWQATTRKAAGRSDDRHAEEPPAKA